jgi:chemotaxis regulatin CheY-phosphate phosphatase CheZ
MTADAANKSLAEAEAAKLLVGATLDSLSKNWSRQDIEASLKLIGGHLTNIIVAQEFQDLAGQSLRKAMKALVGAIVVVEGGGPTEEKRLSQTEVDGLLNDLMP